MILVFTFLKFLYSLRIVSFVGFFIKVIVTVLKDLKQFIIFFALIILFFSSFLGILLNEIEDYEKIYPGGYFIIALRQSNGDYDTDNLIDSEYKTLVWCTYGLIMFIGNFILMNLIITVIGQSYENCQKQRDTLLYKVKLGMIREYESMMSQCELKNRKNFPNFIIVRKPF